MLIQIIKKASAILILPVVFCSFIGLPVYQVNFSGSWKLDEGKSDLGQFGARGTASKIVIEQKTDAMTITKTSMSFQGEEVTTTETLGFDGKVSETTVFGMAKKKSTLKWSEDGQHIIISSTIAFERDGQSFDIKTDETWSVAADGKTFTVQNVMNTPQGEMTTKAVYAK